jgi:hypothetical protein
MSFSVWPQTLSREQVINLLEQYTLWYNDEWSDPNGDYVGDTRSSERVWVEMMENIDPCWPDR